MIRFKAFLVIVLVLAAGALAEEKHDPQSIKFADLKLGLKRDEQYDAKKHLTEAVKSLDGKKVRIRGYIHAASVFKTTGIEKFVLIGDELHFQHNFGSVGPLDALILVEMAEGQSVAFDTKPITVEGTFSLRETKLGDRTIAIYHLQADRAVGKDRR
jgi:hypothetical protein